MTQATIKHEKHACTRCGWCCEHSTIAVSQSDILRWNRTKRKDILIQISFIANYPKQGRAGFFITKTTQNPKQPCPFLLWEDGLAACSINDTKPRICKDFPISKPDERTCPIIISSHIPPALTHQMKVSQARDFKKTAMQHKQLLNILYRVRGLPSGK